MTDDRERWQRARTLFDQLVELEPPVRQPRLEEIGREDPVLRLTVERLLAADSGAESALRSYSFGSPDTSRAGAVASRDPLGMVGQTVSHFRVTGYLAAGGMGVVYTAEDLQLGRTVALKFPLPHQQVDRAVAERFVHEARTAAALDHPNLCSVHEIGDSEHGLFLAMPLYTGETLRDRLDREGALPADVAASIALQVTSGLASAHAAGVVHRDLKPGNVMLVADGSVKVLDFGLAKIHDVDLTKSHMTLGTIGYVAPEQIRREPVDARTDLWAVGVMLYEMVTGLRPFRGDHEMAVLHAVLHEDPPPPSRVRDSVPPAFDAVVAGLLQKEPSARYPSAASLLADLEAAVRGGPLAHRTPFWQRSTRRRRARSLLLPAALATMVVGALGWAAYRGSAGARIGTASAVGPTVRWRRNTAEIGTAAELQAALVPANAGRRLRLRAGRYDIDRPLVVPDGMTIEGTGIMQYGADSLPTGFAEGSQPVIRMTGSGSGDVLTLGDGVRIRGIEVVDLEGRSGNVVAVPSRRPRDTVTVTIVETVIVNPNPLTITPSGALGRGLWTVTVNPNMGADPPPHEGSVVSAHMERSMISSPAGGGGFFAYNFTAGSRVSLVLSRNVIVGSNEANAGVSRPDAVHDSRVEIVSTGNLYRNGWPDRCVSPAMGWNFTGGSGAPIPLALPPTVRNQLHVRSVDDRIEGFTTGIFATGGRRFYAEPLNAAPSDNAIVFELVRTTIATPDCGARVTRGRARSSVMGVAIGGVVDVADLQLYGANVNNEALHAGNRNTVRVEMRGVTGSGRRANVFLDAGGPAGRLPAEYRGAGNRVEIEGDRATFLRLNHGITPGPDASAFGAAMPSRAAGAP